MRASDLETLSGAGRNRKGMLKQSENIVHRLFNRQITRPRPNTHIHQARTLYENIVPSHTIYDVECPDQTFRKFTNDGQYLIGFSRNYQDLVVYRHRWLNFGVKGDAAEQLADLPPRSNKFQSHFSLLHTIPLASGSEAICKDFFLSTENGLYGIFATSSVPDTSNPPTHGAVPGVPSTEKITIFLVSFAEGRITDERSFRDDFIHLAHNMGVFLYDDLLAILSIRFQCIRILQVRETGRFVDVRTIGQHCREDDELVLNSQAQEEVSYHKQLASLRKARGLAQHDVSVAAGNKSPEQGKPWPLLWNLKQPQHGQGPRRERNRRQQPPPASAHGSNTAAELSGHPARSENNGHGDGSADLDANSDGDGIIPNEIHEADLDVQYENYFRGLLASLEDTAVNQTNSSHVVVTDGPGSTVHAQGGLNNMNISGARLPPEATAAVSNGHHHVGGIDPPQRNGSGSNSGGGPFSAERTNAAPTPKQEENGIGSSSQFSAERTIAAPTLQQTSVRSVQNSGGGGVDLRSAYAPLDSIHPDRRNLEGSTSEASSGGGGHHLSAGPSQFGRSSYTSTTSGSSLDRYTSGRGSSSLRYTSTTISSESESQSHRRDFSFSGGSMSYGNGRAAGSVSVQSENGNFVEYVVSSRGGTAVTTSTAQQAVPPEERQPALPSSSFQGGGSDRRGFRVRENGWTFPGEGGGTTNPGNGGNPSHEGHNNGNNTDMPDADDRNLPSGSVDRSTTSVTTINNNTNDRAEVNVNARPAPVSVRESNNGNGNWNNRPRPPRDGDNGNAPGGGGGAVLRNRPIGSASPGGNEVEGTQVLGGIKQRLLSFIFQGVVNDHISPATKAQRLKRFYYHFQHYVDLVMWKVQFLDRYHLLIKFGSVDGVLQRNSDTSHQTAFLAIFNLETTEMLGFYQNSSDEFLLSFEQFCDHFRVAPRYPLYMNFISSYSNNSHVREQLRKQRLACNSSKAGNYSQVVKRTLAWVPFNAQCQSPSPYFDQSLFHYDEKLISAIDRHKPCMEHPIKFLSRRRPNCLKFKLSPGPEHGASDGRTKRVASFIFHPIFPFAISIQQSYMQPSIINFHFRK